AAPGRGTLPEPVEITPASTSDASRVLAAAALLGLGETRAAEHLVEPSAAATPPNAAKTAPPARSTALEVMFTRALASAGDVPFTKASVRLRDAVDRILADWK